MLSAFTRKRPRLLPFLDFTSAFKLSRKMTNQPGETHNFPKEEEKILEYWKKVDAFKTSLKLSKGKPR